MSLHQLISIILLFISILVIIVSFIGLYQNHKYNKHYLIDKAIFSLSIREAFGDIYLVCREDYSSRFVMILKDEKSNKYRFVNITKDHCHICKCEFDTIEDAFKDMDNDTKVKTYYKV